jgi:hypothetical protein
MMEQKESSMNIWSYAFTYLFITLYEDLVVQNSKWMDLKEAGNICGIQIGYTLKSFSLKHETVTACSIH